jgi:hypothetical protein
MSRLGQARELLDEGLLTLEELDALKRRVLEDM